MTDQNPFPSSRATPADFGEATSPEEIEAAAAANEADALAQRDNALAEVDALKAQVAELTDQSLTPEVCEEILALARGIPGIEQPHNLRTRMVGRYPVIDLHVRLRADLPLREAHEIATSLEHALRDRFGKETIANLHLEPYSA